MGRLKRERRKFHLKPVGSKIQDEDFSSPGFRFNDDSSLPLANIPDTLFSGINISLDDLKSRVDEVDRKSVRSWKSSKSDVHLSKKLKQKLRREEFLKKIDAFYQARKEKKLQTERQKTVITGDMKPLLDALPDVGVLDESIEDRSDRPNMKKRSTAKATKRRNDLLANIDAFRCVLHNPRFQDNPMEVISANILKQMELFPDDKDLAQGK